MMVGIHGFPGQRIPIDESTPAPEPTIASLSQQLDDERRQHQQELAERDAQYAAEIDQLKQQHATREQELGQLAIGWQYAAEHDDLTGLNNMRVWKKEICTRLDRGEAVAVLFLDLDDFKAVNDLAANMHAEGDDVLVDLGERLQALLKRAGDLVTVRRSGDEFLIAFNPASTDWVLSDRRQTHPYEQVDAFYEYICTELVEPFAARYRQQYAPSANFGVSIGVAVSTHEHPLTYRQLMGQAEESMREAKPNDDYRQRLAAMALHDLQES